MPLVDELHLDICDGHLVPNISFGSQLVASIRSAFPSAVLDTHLMIENPHYYLQSFLEAGSNQLTFHFEAALHPLKLREYIVQHKRLAGIALIPRSDVTLLRALQGFFTRLLIMTVNPGFGGQKIILEMLHKVEQLRKEWGDEIDIVVDGGINLQNIAEAHHAGANVFVIGNALFQRTARKSYIEDIRASIS